MARRSGFMGIMNAMARDAARISRQAEVERRRLERMRVRAAKEAQRALALADKEARIRYQEARAEEVYDLNEELNIRILDLNGILEHTLNVNDAISFDLLRIKESFKPFTPPEDLADPPAKPLKEHYLSQVKAPSLIGKLLPGSAQKYEAALQEAEIKFMDALKKHEEEEAKRQSRLTAIKEEYEKKKNDYLLKVQQRNQEVDEFKEQYDNGEYDAVVAYNSMVLERSEYPDDFPQKFRLAYVPESKELVVEYQLPDKNVVPVIAEHKYVKSKDQITEKARKVTEVKEQYVNIVAAVTLKTLHEIFEADQGGLINVIVFNGFVESIDPATGKDITPCLISVRATRETFIQIDLSRIDKLACLKNLGAQVSPRPTELQAVKPIIEFDMVDKRFVEHDDILGSLDASPNLMDLNPFEFENLVSNLFGKMGLDAKLTRSAKDGGVDAVAFDTRAIIGGKIVIQAKRHKNTVGVSAVRELYGTMLNEGANKGILVTTSGYGPDAYEFVKDKPIELIDGRGLLYLLEQNGIKARIIFS